MDTHTVQAAGFVKQRNSLLTGRAHLLPDHMLNTSYLKHYKPFLALGSAFSRSHPREMTVLLFGCLSRFWLKIGLVGDSVVLQQEQSKEGCGPGPLSCCHLATGSHWTSVSGGDELQMQPGGAP